MPPEDAPTAQDAPKDEPLKKFELRGSQLTAQFDAKSWELDAGVALLSATLVPAESGSHRMMGRVTLPDGSQQEFVAEPLPPAAIAPEAADPPAEEGESPESNADAEDTAGDERASADVDRAASFAVNYPLGAFGVSEPPAQPEWIVFRQATVWTCGPAGVLERADVLVHRGRIERVSAQLDDVPEGTWVVDCAGRHLTPGIIDCHSHMATDGGVNEGTQAITAEVRIGDFIDATDVSIYRQLAGGVTVGEHLARFGQSDRRPEPGD